MNYVFECDALSLAASLAPKSVALLCFDPPYGSVVRAKWDNQWGANHDKYADWLDSIIRAFHPALTDTASIVFFGSHGFQGNRPFFQTISRLDTWLSFRDLLTWAKTKAIGRPDRYLFAREEIVWYSVSKEEWTFNVPVTDIQRRYTGGKRIDGTRSTKSDFYRVTNVIKHIPELYAPERECQKPVPLMELLIATHSNPGDLVVDPFTGWGTTGVAARKLGRDFLGCDTDAIEVPKANQRIREVRP